MSDKLASVMGKVVDVAGLPRPWNEDRDKIVVKWDKLVITDGKVGQSGPVEW